MCCLDKIERITNDLIASSPPHSAHSDKAPRPNNPPYQKDQVQFLFIPEWQVSVSYQPMEITQKSQSKLPKGTTGWVPHPPNTTKYPSHSP